MNFIKAQGPQANRVNCHSMFAVIFIALVGTGCATPLPEVSTTRPIEKAEMPNFKEQPNIFVVRYEPEPFQVETERGIAQGLIPALIGEAIGQYVDRRKGETITKKYSLQDPSLQVKTRFVSVLTADLGLTTIRRVEQPFPKDDTSNLRGALGTGVVIDFKTTKWSYFLNLPGEGIQFMPKSRYGVKYDVRARLIRLDDAKILWEAVCQYWEDPKRSVLLEELEANNGAILKTKFSEAAEFCFNGFRTQFPYSETQKRGTE